MSQQRPILLQIRLAQRLEIGLTGKHEAVHRADVVHHQFVMKPLLEPDRVLAAGCQNGFRAGGQNHL